ncbi:hypothetical protein PS918_01124 [Pseudomonas fluorescens]|uniref:Uncharacterized protein n=1 Tax=Pseudomonas fluorescens TaxID=294 RepID=A0A5E7RAD3_PSEFL|nr:hypothetical protein [Pseudomonas fluorescens]VVP71079.1 hypothetical protein PS918_01124 [Pseudomonas fluorescens]
MTVELFRAIPESKLAESSEGYRRQSTLRIPSNVPYVVDNLWEWLRPDSMPSRRHAVYASGTPELALENASAPLANGDCYVACRVVVGANEIRVAQLQVSDARNHEDIRMISRWLSRHSREFTEISLAERQVLALLFSPGLRQKELEELRQQSQLIQNLCAHVQEHSTLWPTASTAPNATSGELFFELLGSALYRLAPLPAVSPQISTNPNMR